MEEIKDFDAAVLPCNLAKNRSAKIIPCKFYIYYAFAWDLLWNVLFKIKSRGCRKRIISASCPVKKLLVESILRKQIFV